MIRTQELATAGSYSVPAPRSISASAASAPRAGRYGRCDIMASTTSATISTLPPWSRSPAVRPARISRAVATLVVLIHEFGDRVRHVSGRDDVVASLGMSLDEAVLGRREDSGHREDLDGHRHLADVVQQARHPDVLDVGLRQTKVGCYRCREFGHAALMARRVGVAHLGHRPDHVDDRRELPAQPLHRLALGDVVVVQQHAADDRIIHEVRRSEFDPLVAAVFAQVPVLNGRRQAVGLQNRHEVPLQALDVVRMDRQPPVGADQILRDASRTTSRCWGSCTS